MSIYRASNGKVIDTDKMEGVADLSYDGAYGNVDSTLYRTRKSHAWYIVSESSWFGTASISDAEEIDLDEAAGLVMEHCPDSINDYPELKEHVDKVIDE